MSKTTKKVKLAVIQSAPDKKQYLYPFYIKCSKYTLRSDIITLLQQFASGTPPKPLYIDYDKSVLSHKKGKSVISSIIISNDARVACKEIIAFYTTVSQKNNTVAVDATNNVNNDILTTIKWKDIQSTEMAKQAVSEYLFCCGITDIVKLQHGVSLVIMASFIGILTEKHISVSIVSVVNIKHNVNEPSFCYVINKID